MSIITTLTLPACPLKDWQTPGKVIRVDADWIRANVNLGHARYIFQRCEETMPPPSPHYPPNEPPAVWLPSFGTWRLDPYGELSILVNLPVAAFQPAEGEWEIANRYPSTMRYVEWYRQGHTPPALSAVRNVNGKIYSLNRRRWLAARTAGISHVPVWFSETHPIHRARSLWYLPEHSAIALRHYQIAQREEIPLRNILSDYEIEAIERYGSV